MILILSGQTDPHVPFVMPKLRALGADVLWFDPGDLPARAELTLELGERGFVRKLLRLRDRTVDLAGVSAVWLRRPNPPEAGPRVVDPDVRTRVAEYTSDAIHGAFELLECLWVPARPRTSRAASNKVWQLQVAAELGFRVPRTCITCSPDDFLDFVAGADGPVIGKQLGNGTPTWKGEAFPPYTDVVHRRSMLNAQLVRHAPTIFQDYVPKRLELRVTVVGDRLFAAAIDSQASPTTKHDWRHYDDDRAAYALHRLPREIESLCFRLVERFGLTYGAIDMVLTPSGEYVFLEINPNGQWGWIEETTGIPIAEAVADLLMRNEPVEQREGELVAG